MSDLERFALMIKESNNIVFFGGAGVSTESGIPDFRSVDGLYNQKYKFRPETILSHTFYVNNKDEFYRFYRDKMLCLDAAPNAAHLKLAELERAGKLKAVITQNIDGLHQRAGSRAVWELHGNWERLVCTSCGAVASLGDSVRVDGDPVPACPSCASQMRPDIVMYGESLDQGVIEAAVSAISRASTLIVAGTSLVVYPAAGLINYFSGDHLVLLNATPTSADAHADLIIREPVGATLDRVMDELRARGVLPA